MHSTDYYDKTHPTTSSHVLNAADSGYPYLHSDHDDNFYELDDLEEFDLYY